MPSGDQDFWRTLASMLGVNIPGGTEFGYTTPPSNINEWQKQMLLNYIMGSPHLGSSEGIDKIIKSLFTLRPAGGPDQPDPWVNVPPERVMDYYKMGFGTEQKDYRGRVTSSTGADPYDMLRAILADWTYAGTSEEGGKLPPGEGTFKQLEDKLFHQTVGAPLYHRWGQDLGEFGRSSMPWEDWTKGQKGMAQGILGFYKQKEAERSARYARSEAQRKAQDSGGFLGNLFKTGIKTAASAGLGGLGGIGGILGSLGASGGLGQPFNWEDFDWEEWLRQYGGGGGMDYNPGFFGGEWW